jgi:hypothetical protein
MQTIVIQPRSEKEFSFISELIQKLNIKAKYIDTTEKSAEISEVEFLDDFKNSLLEIKAKNTQPITKLFDGK